MCRHSFAIRFSDESQLRHLCEQYGVNVVHVDYADNVTLHLQMKLSIAGEFEQDAFSLLRGNLLNVTV